MSLEGLVGEVRERLRDHGGAPDAATLRNIVDDVVRDSQETFAAGGAPGSGPGMDAGPDIAARLLDRLAGYGPLSALMADPSVEEVWVNGPSRVFCARDGDHQLTTVVFRPHELEELVERLLAASGRRLDRSSPFVDARLPDGSRLHVVIPPVTGEWSVNIRKFVGLRAHRLGELVAMGSLTPDAARFLDAAVRCGLTTVVCGPVGSGKTTLLNCLAAAIPPKERVVTCEEVFELQIGVPDVVSMQCRQAGIEGGGEIGLRTLVKESLRMRPDRLVIGEVRGAECLDLLVALNAGCAAMTSVHANSARDALRKLTTLPLLAGGNVDRRFVESTVAAVVDVVVHTGRDPGTGRRRVEEVLCLSEQVGGDGTITADPVFRRDGSEPLRWSGIVPRPERFAAAGMDIAAMLSGDRP